MWDSYPLNSFWLKKSPLCSTWTSLVQRVHASANSKCCPTLSGVGSGNDCDPACRIRQPFIESLTKQPVRHHSQRTLISFRTLPLQLFETCSDFEDILVACPPLALFPKGQYTFTMVYQGFIVMLFTRLIYRQNQFHHLRPFTACSRVSPHQDDEIAALDGKDSLVAKLVIQGPNTCKNPF